METVVTEGAVRTVETVTNRVVTNKTIVQRTANTNSTHVNRYDADGNLKSSETDTKSWEDRDTKTYEWSQAADQPTEAIEQGGSEALAVGGEQLSVEKFLTEEPASMEPGATVVMTTTDLVPGVRWSGTTVEQSESTVVAAPGSDGKLSDVQTNQRTTTNMAGESWSRSGEAVWISEAPKKNLGSSPVTPLAIENSVPVGVLVDLSTTSNCAADAVGVVTPSASGGSVDVPASSVTTSTGEDIVEQPKQLSVDERRRKRCAENRARKAASDVDATTTTAASSSVRTSTTPGRSRVRAS